MSTQVKVEDLEVFRHFRAALLKFAQSAQLALSNADSHIGRTHSWLENEQASFWQGQLRKRAEALTRARDAVRNKKLFKDATGRTPSAQQEEKVLAQCVAAVEEAERKIAAIRKWLPRLEKEADIFRGGISRLNRSLTGDIPNALALLDRLALSLEQYLQIEAPILETAPSEPPGPGGMALAPDEPPSPAPTSTLSPSSSPPPETSSGTPQTAPDSPAPAPTPAAHSPTEHRHVADGQ